MAPDNDDTLFTVCSFSRGDLFPTTFRFRFFSSSAVSPSFPPSVKSSLLQRQQKKRGKRRCSVAFFYLDFPRDRKTQKSEASETVISSKSSKVLLTGKRSGRCTAVATLPSVSFFKKNICTSLKDKFFKKYNKINFLKKSLIEEVCKSRAAPLPSCVHLKRIRSVAAAHFVLNFVQ